MHIIIFRDTPIFSYVLLIFVGDNREWCIIEYGLAATLKERVSLQPHSFSRLSLGSDRKIQQPDGRRYRGQGSQDHRLLIMMGGLVYIIGTMRELQMMMDRLCDATRWDTNQMFFVFSYFIIALVYHIGIHD